MFMTAHFTHVYLFFSMPTKITKLFQTEMILHPSCQKLIDNCLTGHSGLLKNPEGFKQAHNLVREAFYGKWFTYSITAHLVHHFLLDSLIMYQVKRWCYAIYTSFIIHENFMNNKILIGANLLYLNASSMFDVNWEDHYWTPAQSKSTNMIKKINKITLTKRIIR